MPPSKFFCFSFSWNSFLKSDPNSTSEPSLKTVLSVNTLSLAGVLTDYDKLKIMKKAQTNNCSYDDQYKQSVSNVPLRKYAAPEEIASIIQFLLSEASNHLTGIYIPCDGGFTKCY